MIYRFVIYLQPWEIDDFERQVNQLILSSYYISKENKNGIIFDITLNISSNFIDWEKSSIPKDFIKEKFIYSVTKLSKFYKTEIDFNENDLINGAADKRRNCIDKIQDVFIWLDYDIFFSNKTLYYMIESINNITDNYFVLTPQIIKYWDNSWDIITNQLFLNEKFNHRDYFDMFSLDNTIESQNISLKKITTFKFGAGWFTCISDKLLKKAGIPVEIGHYGPDDTYIMNYCNNFKDKLNINQYILENIIVTEIGKTYLENKNYFKKHFVTKFNTSTISMERLFEISKKYIMKDL